MTGWCSAGLSLQSGLCLAIVSPGQAACDKKQIQTLALASSSVWPLDSGLAEFTSRRIDPVPVLSKFLDLNGKLDAFNIVLCYSYCSPNLHSKSHKDISSVLHCIPLFSLAVIVKSTIGERVLVGHSVFQRDAANDRGAVGCCTLGHLQGPMG